MFSLFADEIAAYGSGGQTPTSDQIEEDAARLSNKTSLTPNEGHKVVIRVSDSDSDLGGNFFNYYY